jgi:hypothetical protein
MWQSVVIILRIMKVEIAGFSGAIGLDFACFTGIVEGKY